MRLAVRSLQLTAIFLLTSALLCPMARGGEEALEPVAEEEAELPLAKSVETAESLSAPRGEWRVTLLLGAPVKTDATPGARYNNSYSDSSQPSQVGLQTGVQMQYQRANGIGVAVQETFALVDQGSQRGFFVMPTIETQIGKLRVWAGLGFGVLRTERTESYRGTNTASSTSVAVENVLGIDLPLGRRFFMGAQLAYLRSSEQYTFEASPYGYTDTVNVSTPISRLEASLRIGWRF